MLWQLLTSTGVMILAAGEAPVLRTLELKKPTDEHRREVADLLTEYEIASLEFDRFMAVGSGSITTVFEGGKGAEIREFRSVFAENLNAKLRRLIHSHDIPFREDSRSRSPGFSVLGEPHADCLIKVGPPDRMWLASGPTRLANVAKDAKRNSYDPFGSTFRFRSCNNPFCMAQFGVTSHCRCRCHEVHIQATRPEKLTGYAKTDGLVVFRWFHPVRGSKDPVVGVNDYVALRDGKIVATEEWVGQDHSEKGVLESARGSGYLQSRGVTTWGKIGKYTVPTHIRSNDGKGLREFQVKFKWLFDERVPAELFESSTVGELPVGKYF